MRHIKMNKLYKCSSDTTKLNQLNHTLRDEKCRDSCRTTNTIIVVETKPQ